VLQHTTFSHPTSSLPKIFPCSLRARGWPWATKSEGVYSFQDFQPVVLIHQRQRQTDGRTDRRTTCNRKTALCTIVHRAVKTSRRKRKREFFYDHACIDLVYYLLLRKPWLRRLSGFSDCVRKRKAAIRFFRSSHSYRPKLVTTGLIVRQ